MSSDKFISIVGHKDILKNLNERIKKENLPHGLLFLGPKGIGKSTLAYQLAYALFGKKELVAKIDIEDPLFRRLLQGSHADFKHIRLGFNEEGKAHQEIPLEAIRNIVQFLQVTPLEGGWRVVLIEDAEFLSRKAANALLKSLEEPPTKTLLILCASQEQQVLPTLRSRCQRVVFNKLEKEDVKKVLLEYHSFSEEEITPLMKFSEGSPGRAILLSQLGGHQFYQEFFDMLQEAITGKYSFLFTFVENYTQVKIEKGFDLYRAIGHFISWWLGSYLIEIHQESGEKSIWEEKQLQILKRFPVKFWVQHYHKINFFYHHPHAVGLERKYCLAFILLGIVFGPNAYNEGITNEFC